MSPKLSLCLLRSDTEHSAVNCVMDVPHKHELCAMTGKYVTYQSLMSYLTTTCHQVIALREARDINCSRFDSKAYTSGTEVNQSINQSRKP